MLYLLQLSLESEAGFERVAELFRATPVKLVVWLILTGLLYHLIAGIKHLLMDWGSVKAEKGSARRASYPDTRPCCGSFVLGDDMVTNATSFSRSGLSDWIIQRFSAVILAAYTLFILAVLIATPELDYETWRAVLSKNSVRLFSIISLFALCGHTWVGMWTVGTDYLTGRQLGGKGTFIRLIYQSFCVLLIAVYLLWGIQIFWGS